MVPSFSSKSGTLPLQSICIWSKGQLLLVINSCPQQNSNKLINGYPRKHSLRNIKVGDAYRYSILLFQDYDIIHISHLTRDMSAAFNRFFLDL